MVMFFTFPQTRLQKEAARIAKIRPTKRQAAIQAAERAISRKARAKRTIRLGKKR